MAGLEKKHGRWRVVLLHGEAIEFVMQGAPLLLPALVERFPKCWLAVQPEIERLWIDAKAMSDADNRPAIRCQLGYLLMGIGGRIDRLAAGPP